MSDIVQLLTNASDLLASARLAEAELQLRAIAAAHPNHPAAHHLLGIALIRLQRHGEAIGAFEKSLQLAPSAEAWLNLIQLYFFTGRKAEAVAAARTASAAYPADPRVAAELARALDRSGDADGALAVSLNAMECFGRLPLLVIHAGSLLFSRGKGADAIELYRKCLVDHPADHRIHSALIFTLHFLPGMTPRSLLQEHQQWNQRHAAESSRNVPAYLNSRDPQRPLRIGYVSPDFRNHGVGRFIAPLLEHHTRTAFQVFAYSDVHTPDSLTHRIRAAVQTYRPTFGLSDAQLAELIRQDQIDILVDLTMHMPSCRLLAFAPARPVQITYLAYCSTTGLAAMDWRITDSFLDPVGTDLSYYSEKSLVIPSYWCYEAPREAESIPYPVPRDANGPILFGCLNNFAKVSEPTLEAWAEILRNVPNSNLLIHAPEGTARNETSHFFQARGITPDRLQFAGRLSLADYLRLHAQCDIALDPFPYNGGTTSCDALYMGTPIVTFAEGRDAPAISRAGSSILSQIGLPRLIATTIPHYVSLAVELAESSGTLATLRQSLRPTMQQSPLMNVAQFIQSLEGAYRHAWQRWCGP